MYVYTTYNSIHIVVYDIYTGICIYKYIIVQLYSELLGSCTLGNLYYMLSQTELCCPVSMACDQALRTNFFLLLAFFPLFPGNWRQPIEPGVQSYCISTYWLYDFRQLSSYGNSELQFSHLWISKNNVFHRVPVKNQGDNAPKAPSTAPAALWMVKCQISYKLLLTLFLVKSHGVPRQNQLCSSDFFSFS